MDVRKDLIINGAVYAAAVAGTMLAQQRGLHTLEYAFKPLMMLVLSSWFFFNSRRVGDRFTLLIQAGLFFSLVGDVALMFQHKDEFNFLIGVAAYLIAQLCYALAFAFNVFEVGGSEGAILSWILSAGLLVFGVSFILDVVGSVNVDDTLAIPVLAFAIAAMLMGIFSAQRYRKTFDRSFWPAFAGAVLITAADALLTDRKFNLRSLEVAQSWVTLLFSIGHFLIAGGCLLHVMDPDTIRRRQALET
jgi:uncharacterized membrane protein YhhN